MRIVHISDTHIGYSQYNLLERKIDFIKAFQRAIEIIIEINPDIVLHTGDMFESSQPDMFTLSKTIEQLKKLKENSIEVIAITGNHDRVLRRGKLPPQKILSDLNLLKLIEPYGITTVSDVLICGFQFMPRSVIGTFLDEKKEQFEDAAEKSSFSVLMFHQGISNYLPFADSFEIFMNDLPANFHYYAAGHIHKFIKENLGKGILSYAGATEFRNSRDAIVCQDRGFNLIDTDNANIKRITLKGLRDFLIYNITEEDAYNRLKDIYDRIDACEMPPVVVINYKFKNTPIDSFNEKLKKIKSRSLAVRIFSTREDPLKELPDKTSSYRELVEQYFRDMPSDVRKLASEIARSKPEHVEDILISFVEEATGIKLKNEPD